MTRRAPGLEILRAEDRHAEELAAFIRAVWNPAATASSVLSAHAANARRNVAEPGVTPPTWIALRAGKVIGYVTTLPIRLWDGRQDWPAYWIKGLMVLPEFRSGPIGYHVLREAAHALPRSGGLAVAPAARRLFTAVGYRDCGAINNWIRPLKPARLLRRLDPAELSFVPPWAARFVSVARASGLGIVAGWSAGLTLRLAAAAGRGNAGLPSEILEPVVHEPELGDLWRRCRVTLKSAVVRDPAYLIPRYHAEPDGLYRWIGVRRRGVLVGLAILRIPRETADERLKGIRVAAISDLLYDTADPKVGLAMLGAVEREAQALKADALLATSSALVLIGLLRRQWYFSIGGTIHLLFRNIGESEPMFAESVKDWWLQRGDGASDDAL